MYKRQSLRCFSMALFHRWSIHRTISSCCDISVALLHHGCHGLRLTIRRFGCGRFGSALGLGSRDSLAVQILPHSFRHRLLIELLECCLLYTSRRTALFCGLTVWNTGWMYCCRYHGSAGPFAGTHAAPDQSMPV